MGWRRGWAFFAGRVMILLAFAAGWPVERLWAQTGAEAASSAAAPPATANDVLVAMAAKAAVIFSGTVVEIDRAEGTGYVDVWFHIERAVRGCPRTGYYVLREWAGLWSGVERYRVGQNLLMLLHARGPSGLSAPVNGLDGAIPIMPGGDAPLARGTGTAPDDTATASAEAVADLRWLGAETMRSVVSARSQMFAKNDVEAEWVGPVVPLAKAGAKSATLGSGSSKSVDGWLSLSAVMALLGAGVESGPVKKPVVTPDEKSLESR